MLRGNETTIAVGDESFEPFSVLFRRKLGFWTIHCLINALPSYLIAVVWLGLWPILHAHWAMLAAVGTFIFGYAILTSSVLALRQGRNLFTRALYVGLVIRTVISVFTIFAIPFGSMLVFTPDLWCGYWANTLVSEVSGVVGLSRLVDGKMGASSGANVGFFEIYATTLVEGVLLSFMLFIVSFVAIIILQTRERRNPARWSGAINP